MGAWGAGLYDDDSALDVRDLWRDYLSVGLSPAEATRLVLGDSKDGDDETAVWLALAQTQWSSGRLQASVRRRAMQILRRGEDLERWEDSPEREKRRAVLLRLERQLRSAMPRARPIRPGHPCDWKVGEEILWRTADGGSATLRVVGFDPRWGGGGSPVCELIQATGAAKQRFKIGVFGRGQFFARRLRRIPPSGARSSRRSQGSVPGIRWDQLDGFLFRTFGLPWRRGTILRHRAHGRSWLLMVVDVASVDGEPLVSVEFPVWKGRETPSTKELKNLDVHRTDDTIRRIRARVVDPKKRVAVAKLARELGVRHPDERVPLRLGLQGYALSGLEVLGVRPAVAPVPAGTVIPWTELDGFLSERIAR